MVAAIPFFAEPCGLEEACGTVLHAHQLIVYTVNKGTQSREDNRVHFFGALLNRGDNSKPIKLLLLAISGRVGGSTAPQPRLLGGNSSVGTLRITQGTHMPIRPGGVAVLAKQKMGSPPAVQWR